MKLQINTPIQKQIYNQRNEGIPFADIAHNIGWTNRETRLAYARVKAYINKHGSLDGAKRELKETKCQYKHIPVCLTTYKKVISLMDYEDTFDSFLNTLVNHYRRTHD